MGIEQVPFHLTPNLFERPLVRSLLKEVEEDVDMEMDIAAEESRGEMWMAPDMAISMLLGTRKDYESMKDLFSKVEWLQKLEDLRPLAQLQR